MCSHWFHQHLRADARHWNRKGGVPNCDREELWSWNHATVLEPEPENWEPDSQQSARSRTRQSKAEMRVPRFETDVWCGRGILLLVEVVTWPPTQHGYVWTRSSSMERSRRTATCCALCAVDQQNNASVPRGNSTRRLFSCAPLTRHLRAQQANLQNIDSSLRGQYGRDHRRSHHDVHNSSSTCRSFRTASNQSFSHKKKETKPWASRKPRLPLTPVWKAGGGEEGDGG